MGISTVKLNGVTLMTVNDTTATANDVINKYFYTADGTKTLGTASGSSTPTLETKSVTPTESIQTITADTGYDGLSSVEVGAISSTYVGSGITQRSGSDLTVSGATVTVPSGYYSVQTTKSVAAGTEGTPTAAKGTVSNHSISVTPSVTNTEGYIEGGTKTGTAVTVSASELVSGDKSISTNGSDIDVTNYSTVSVSVPTGTARSSSDVTASGDTVTIPAGLYSSQVTKSVASGTAGTPSASKGSVSNHSISVTPSVTNTAGYISGGTISGTAVTVSASELVSGNLAIDQNGTGINVTNYATVSVDIPEGSYIRTEIVAQQTFTPSSSQRRATLSITESLIDNDYYIVTLDNVEWITTCNLVWNVDYCLGDIAYLVSTESIDSVYPFGLAWESGTEATIAVGNTNQHTVKIEHLEFVDDPDVTLITKNISANGTYNASSDSADGYNQVVVNVPSSQPNLQAKTNINPTTSSQTITADNGYDGLSSVQINAMSSGSATTPATSITANPIISVNTSGVITATASASQSITPSVSAGYVSSGTAGTVSVSGSNTYQLTTKAAATITPGTTDQTIAAGTYLTGVQTIAGDADLIASNILSGVNIFGVNGSVVIQKYYTGSSTPSSSLGSNGDIYLQQ